MKPLIRVAAITTVAAVTLAAPFAAFAQSNAPMTRGQAKAQLVQLERAGYNPSFNDPNYPNNVHAAITRADNSEGGVADGSYGSSNMNIRQNADVPVAPMSGPKSAYFGR